MKSYYKIPLFLMVLAIGWFIILGLLALVFNVKINDFFKMAVLSDILRITYVSSLYFLLMGVLVYFLKKIDDRPFSSLGFDFNKIKELLWGFGLGILLIVLYYLTIWAGGFIQFSFAVKFSSLFIITVFVALALSFTEEVFFRGFLLQSFMKDFSVWPSVLITSVIFSLTHIFRSIPLTFKIIYFLALVIFGILLSILYLRTKNLWLPIGFHAGIIYMTTIISASHLVQYTDHNIELLTGISTVPVTSGILAVVFLLVFAIIFYLAGKKNQQKEI